MDVALAVQQQTGFTLDLFKKFVENVDIGSNGVMSPLSIVTALAMTAAGAKGVTLAEITSVLKLPEGDAMHHFTSQISTEVLKDGSTAGGPLVSFTNGVWLEKSMILKPKFQELVKGSYRAEVKTADFGNKAEEERVAINSWVLEESKGKIQDLLPAGSLNDQTRLVLANALYFKGAWEKKFRTENTKDEDFHLLNGETVNVPYMVTEEKQYIRKIDNVKVLKLPYAKGEDLRLFSMYILLPTEKNGLPELEKNLDGASLSKYLNWTSLQVKVGKFRLPKFKISTSVDVPKALKSLGLKSPFSEGADFSDMVEGPAAKMLVLSDVFHKAFVEVNEEGTEAAAATAATMLLRSLPVPEQTEEFVADHPFLFVLREDITRVVLFVGRITNPTLSS